MNNWDQEKYTRAWEYASRAHVGQVYSSPEAGGQMAYIYHLASVAMEMIWALPATPSYDADLAIQCALLHDTIEDTDVSREAIAELFGEAVANGVWALSKNPEIEGKPEQMKDSLQRIKEQPKEIWSVKVADRISNLNSPPYHWSKEKRIQYREEAKMIRHTLSGANELLLNRLDRKIDDYQEFIDD